MSYLLNINKIWLWYSKIVSSDWIIFENIMREWPEKCLIKNTTNRYILPTDEKHIKPLT